MSLRNYIRGLIQYRLISLQNINTNNQLYLTYIVKIPPRKRAQKQHTYTWFYFYQLLINSIHIIYRHVSAHLKIKISSTTTKLGQRYKASVTLYSACTVIPMTPLFFRPEVGGNAIIFDYIVAGLTYFSYYTVILCFISYILLAKSIRKCNYQKDVG